MKVLKNLCLITALASLSLQAFAQAQEAQPQLSFNAIEVGTGLYMLQGQGGFTGGNLGLSVGADGVVMIDDSMPPILQIMQEAIARITDKPVDFLINTHVHGDHIGNNENMAKTGTRIVAHENLRHHLLEKGVQTQDGMKPAPKLALPVITFSEAMTFHLNDNDAYVFHAAKAHTDGDAIIKFKQANVIHTGDIFFNGMFPFIDLNSGGSVDGFIAAQKKILQHADNETKIIPGHGPLATKADLVKAVVMLEDAQKLVVAAMQNGASEEDVVKANPLQKYHADWNWNFITTERMTKTIYQDAKQKAAAE